MRYCPARGRRGKSVEANVPPAFGSASTPADVMLVNLLTGTPWLNWEMLAMSFVTPGLFRKMPRLSTVVSAVGKRPGRLAVLRVPPQPPLGTPELAGAMADPGPPGAYGELTQELFTRSVGPPCVWGWIASQRMC